MWKWFKHITQSYFTVLDILIFAIMMTIVGIGMPQLVIIAIVVTVVATLLIGVPYATMFIRCWLNEDMKNE